MTCNTPGIPRLERGEGGGPTFSSGSAIMVSLLRLLGVSAKHLSEDVSTTVSQKATTGSATFTSTSAYSSLRSCKQGTKSQNSPRCYALLNGVVTIDDGTTSLYKQAVLSDLHQCYKTQYPWGTQKACLPRSQAFIIVMEFNTWGTDTPVCTGARPSSLLQNSAPGARTVPAPDTECSHEEGGEQTGASASSV